MSNYTKTTDFEAKDSLPSGDSGKIIRGSEFETEFDNIATAIASKSDANNPTFTGTVTIDGLTVNGNTVLGNAASDTVTVTADIASNLLPSADDTYNLGAVGAEWNDLFIDGVANIDSLVADTADINGGTVDGVTIGGSSAGAITGTTITGTGFVTSGNMTFGDNDKAVFGAGSDLQIYHDGSHSYVDDQGTGQLRLKGTTQIQFLSGANDYMATMVNDGAVNLYYDNNLKLATTSTGIDVTGTATMDRANVGTSTVNYTGTDLTVGDNSDSQNGLAIQTSTSGIGYILFGDGSGASAYRGEINYSHATDSLTFKTSGIPRLNINSTGIDVTGTVTADGLTLDAGQKVIYNANGSQVNSRKYQLRNDDSAFGDFGIKASSSNSTEPTKNRFNINKDGDISFYEDSGTTAKFFWDSSAESLNVDGKSTVSSATDGVYIKYDTGVGQIFGVDKGFNGWNDLDIRCQSGTQLYLDTSGNVGIGTSSPAAKLEIDGGTGSATAGGTLVVRQKGDTSADGIAITSSDSVSHRIWKDASGNLNIGSSSFPNSFVQDFNGNVGIGTANTGRRLTVDGSGLRVQDTSSADFYSTGQDALIVNNGTANLRLWNNGSERMRLDASGNLLVSKTASSLTTVGCQLQATGLVRATVDGADVLQLNRKTSDGAIASFYKSGATVGSIGTSNSRLHIGNGDVGLLIAGDLDNITPWNSTTGASRDAAVDLGNSGVRFKDLYLSGGAYLGGTAAANKLDDYEEGTFTPVIQGATTAGTFTYGTQSAAYTKIGNTVTFHVAINVTATSVSPVGLISIKTLPFTITSVNFQSFAVGWTAGITFPDQIGAYGVTAGNSIVPRKITSGGSGSQLDASDLNSSFWIFVSGTYQTS